MTTLPVHYVTLPAVLAGRQNGQLPDSILHTTPGQAAGPDVRLVAPAARAWRALCAAALSAGHILKATSLYDSYRPYNVQEAIFRARYSSTRIAGADTRFWQGRTWWQKPGTATAAVPGTSNHGLGLAVDIGDELDGDAGTEAIDTATVNWLVVNAARFGFSAELQSEPWHWRYYPGDTIPTAVLVYEYPRTPEQEKPMPDLLILDTHGDPGKVYARYADGHTVHLGPTEYGYWARKEVPQISLTNTETDVVARLEAARIDVAS